MTSSKTLVACVGNIFMGDDGFGVEVARRLAGCTLPAGVTVRDFGIRGIDLTYAVLDPWDLVILVDACSRGGKPGTVYVIEPELAARHGSDSVAPKMDAHGMDPAKVLQMARSMGGMIGGRVLVVGCEPADLGSYEEGKLGLSEPVMDAMDEAVRLVEKLVAGIHTEEPMEAIAQAR